MQSELRGLITGCGRSGTLYLSEILKFAGESCGHETAFDVFGQHQSPHDFESSWYAVPFLSQLKPGTPILHLVRDPYKVISSFYRIGLLSTLPFRHVTYGHNAIHPRAWMLSRKKVRARWRFVIQHRHYLHQHLNIWNETDEVQRLVDYWLLWNKKVETESTRLCLPYLRVRIEDINQRLDEVAEFLSIRPDLAPQPPANLKSGYRHRPAPLIKFSDALTSMSREYGY